MAPNFDDRGVAVERLNISEAVAALRAELTEAILASDGEAIRFEVGEIELAFEVAVERSAKGGIKFWVVEIGAGGSSTETHTVRIPLKPTRLDGRPVLTGGTDEVPRPPVPPTG